MIDTNWVPLDNALRAFLTTSKKCAIFLLRITNGKESPEISLRLVDFTNSSTIIYIYISFCSLVYPRCMKGILTFSSLLFFFEDIYMLNITRIHIMSKKKRRGTQVSQKVYVKTDYV